MDLFLGPRQWGEHPPEGRDRPGEAVAPQAGQPRTEAQAGSGGSLAGRVWEGGARNDPRPRSGLNHSEKPKHLRRVVLIPSGVVDLLLRV